MGEAIRLNVLKMWEPKNSMKIWEDYGSYLMSKQLIIFGMKESEREIGHHCLCNKRRIWHEYKMKNFQSIIIEANKAWERAIFNIFIATPMGVNWQHSWQDMFNIALWLQRKCRKQHVFIKLGATHKALMISFISKIH